MDRLNELLDINHQLSENQIKALDRYLDLLLEWNGRYNLTSITNRDEALVKHFYDSLLLWENYSLEGSLCDVGSGGGFPGIPLKIACPDLEVTLMDATRKKCIFLQNVADDLQLNGIKVLNRRAEEATRDPERYDIVTARAVASLNVLLELCTPLLKTGGRFYALKGPGYSEELEASQKALRKLSCEVTDTRILELPNQQTRAIIEITKTGETPRIFPRKYSQIVKKPL